VSVFTHDPPSSDRRVMRFMAFAVAVVIGVGALTGRLVQLQVLQGGQYSDLSSLNSRAIQAIPSSRGLIFDRNGVPLVANIPSFTVKVRPADLSLVDREQVVGRLASLLGMDPGDINATIDSNPGSRFDAVRIARDIPEDTARTISENHLELPGVEVVVEPRRSYLEGTLVSQLVGYTGPVDAEQLKDLEARGYLPDDLIGKAGVEATYEDWLRGTYGEEEVEKDARGRKLQVLQTVKPAQAGSSLELTIDLDTQRNAETAMQWAMDLVGIQRGVVIVMNPQTGELKALVSLPTYDDNLFAGGISAADYQALLENPGKPLLNHAINGHYPPGSTYKLVAGTGALADGKISATTKVQTKGYLTLGKTRFYEWNKRGFGQCDIRCGFGHSSDTFFFQMGAALGIDGLAHWAAEYGFGEQTGVDLPGEVRGIVPSSDWKMNTFGQPVYPGEVYQAAIGQGYDVVTPLQLINAYAALANGGTLYEPQIVHRILGPDGEVVRDFQPKVLHKMDVEPSVLKTMREAARNVVLLRHTYNLVDMPLIVAGKTGTAEFGVRDSKGRLPFHSWFVGFLPKDPTKQANDPTGMKAVARTDSDLAVLVFAYDSRTKGNAATEIAKKFLQLQYGIKQDYTRVDLLERGNFYGN
jgi:penicillin-binding protein 2